jgi:CubicO group peptidase (beta-lactamase class C family)
MNILRTAGSLWSSGTAALGAQETDLAHRVSERMAPFVSDGFSGSILVERAGQVVNLGFGLAVRENETGVTPSTVFDIGSVSKQFTKAAILKLSETGRLSMDDRVGSFFSETPADKRNITIGHLIQMESGLAEYVDLPDEPGDFAPLDRAAARARILSQELQFEPGSQRAYSNSGYTLLALIVEQVTGGPFTQYLRNELLAPAGLARTGFYHEQDRWAENEVARGYNGNQFGEVNSPFYWPEMQWALVGNGGMVSSPAELLKWIRSLREGKVLGPAGVDALYSGAPPTGSAPADRPVVLYAGANDFGFETVVLELYGDGGVVIVSSNNAAPTVEIATALGEVVSGAALDLSPFLSPGDNEGTEDDQGWGLPDSPRGRRASEFLDAMAAGSESALRDFLELSVSDVFRNAYPIEEHLSVLGDTQRGMADPDVMMIEATGEFSMEMVVVGRTTGERFRISLELEPETPHRIASIEIEN